MKEKRYVLLYDPYNSDGWESCVSVYRARASETKDGFVEIYCSRWFPEDKLKLMLEALRTATAEMLEDKRIYLHCQDVLLSTMALKYIRAMIAEFGVIATNEYGVIE